MLTTLGQVTPYGGFTVLREVSQRTNIKLSQVAEDVLEYAQGATPPEVLGRRGCMRPSPATSLASGRIPDRLRCPTGAGVRHGPHSAPLQGRCGP
ncbi:ANTAR domain-containing protein [Streptomyces sp. NPDC057301]|uniref:ANTAR domain-containing protein n=1 Tax=Streptomyces sp. NPDC057301 TaxID=3346093 RepID=UPI003633347C